MLEVVIPFPLIAYAEQHVSSSLAAILISSLPLTIALLAMRFDHEERVRGARLAGLVVGLTGVVVLLGLDVAGDTQELIGALAILIGVLGYAAGPLVLKRHLRDLDPLGPIAAAMGVATVLLAPAAALTAPTEVPGGGAIAALVALGLLCTALAFLLMFMLVADVGPSRASIITYINPIIALALGVAFLGESITLGAMAGLLLILAGSLLATGGRLPPGLRRGERYPAASSAVWPSPTVKRSS